MDQLRKFFMLKAAATGDSTNIQSRLINPVTSMPGAMTQDLKRLGYGVRLSKLNDPDNIVAFNRVLRPDEARRMGLNAPKIEPNSTIDLYFDDQGYVMPKGNTGKYIGAGVGAAGGLAGAVYLHNLANKWENYWGGRGRDSAKNDPWWDRGLGGTSKALRIARTAALLGLPIAGSIIGAKIGGNFDNPRGLKVTYAPEYAEGSPGANGVLTRSTQLQRFMRDLWSPGRFSLRRRNTQPEVETTSSDVRSPEEIRAEAEAREEAKKSRKRSRGGGGGASDTTYTDGGGI